MPARVTRGPIGQGAIKIPDDIELPGWMDPNDPTKVAIDWSGFRSDPESKAAVEDAGAAEADRNYAVHNLRRTLLTQEQYDAAVAVIEGG